jgi:hypothetical protein
LQNLATPAVQGCENGREPSGGFQAREAQLENANTDRIANNKLVGFVW